MKTVADKNLFVKREVVKRSFDSVSYNAAADDLRINVSQFISPLQPNDEQV